MSCDCELVAVPCTVQISILTWLSLVLKVGGRGRHDDPSSSGEEGVMREKERCERYEGLMGQLAESVGSSTQ